MQDWNIQDRPNKLPWPPLLLAASILIGFGLDRFVPLALPAISAVRIVGALIIILALALDIWASLTFRSAKTTILPHQGSAALVTHGPFAYSRNPIYLGNLFILCGVGLLFGSLWHVLLIVPLAVAIYRLAIKREEAHLGSRFPQAWANYSSKVRRWI